MTIGPIGPSGYGSPISSGDRDRQRRPGARRELDGDRSSATVTSVRESAAAVEVPSATAATIGCHNAVVTIRLRLASRSSVTPGYRPRPERCDAHPDHRRRRLHRPAPRPRARRRVMSWSRSTCCIRRCTSTPRAPRAFPGEVVVGDVADEAAPGSSAASTRSCHLAAETGTGQSMYEQDRYRRVNVDGTRLAGEYAARRCPARRAELAGGVRRRHCCDACRRSEDDPHLPVSFYGETKSLGEAASRTPAEHVRRHDHPAAERHRPRPGPPQPVHRRARGLPGDAARRPPAHGLRRRQPDPRLHPRPGPRRAHRLVRRAPGRGRPAPRAQLRDRCTHHPARARGVRRSRARPMATCRSSTSTCIGPATSSTPAPTSPAPPRRTAAAVDPRDAVVDFIRCSWDKPGDPRRPGTWRSTSSRRAASPTAPGRPD